MSVGGPPGGYGPRPVFYDDEKTPTAPHAKPAPVVVRSGTMPKQPPPLPPQRKPTPIGTLSALDRGPIQQDEARAALMSRMCRVCDGLSQGDLRLVVALAIRLHPGPAADDR